MSVTIDPSITLAELVTQRVLHEGIGRDDEVAGEPTADEECDRREEVPARTEPALASVDALLLPSELTNLSVGGGGGTTSASRAGETSSKKRRFTSTSIDTKLSTTLSVSWPSNGMSSSARKPSAQLMASARENAITCMNWRGPSGSFGFTTSEKTSSAFASSILR